MKSVTTCLAAVAFIFLFQSPVLVFGSPVKATGTVDTYFSPRGGATEATVKEINAARREILVQAYSFTSPQIAKALLQAHKRGVRIEAVLDKSNKKKAPGKANYSAATFLDNAGIPTLIDSKHAIAHNKIMIIDGETLITGSFNFTKAAEMSNAENLLVIKGNKPLVDRYLENYREHRGHAELYGKM